MAGRPPKLEPASGAQTERALELSDLDEAMATKYYPNDERRREGFIEFLRALRPGTPNPKSNTRAVHVYFYDEALKALYEGWRALISNRQIKSGDSMSRVVGTMVIEYVRLAKMATEAQWERMREKIEERMKADEALQGQPPPDEAPDELTN